MNEQQERAARKLCPNSDLTMGEILAWDRHHYDGTRWQKPGGSNHVLDVRDLEVDCI